MDVDSVDESEPQAQQAPPQGLQLSGLPDSEQEEEDGEDEDEMDDATAELPANVAHTLEQAQRARHDAGITSAVDLDLCHMAAAVAATSAASSSATPSAPPSATQEHLAENQKRCATLV